MSNALDIPKILVITTSVFAYIRFDLEKIDVNRLLKDLKKFYSRRMKDWSYDEFIEIFLENWPKHYESFEEFKKGQDWSFSIRKDNRPTDNAQKISEFRPVFLELFNHALLLNSENKSEQLSDFFDTIHCLSEAMLWKGQWDSKSFWKLRIKTYCKRWGVRFPGMRKAFIPLPFLSKFR